MIVSSPSHRSLNAAASIASAKGFGVRAGGIRRQATPVQSGPHEPAADSTARRSPSFLSL